MSDRDNLDAELAAEWQAIQARHMESDEGEAKPEPEAEESDDRARDDKGRFAAKAEDAPEDAQESAEKPAEDKPEAKAEDKPAPAQEAAEASPEASEQEAAPQRDLNRPPASWKPAAKAAWDNLPPEIKAEVHRRESDWFKGQSRIRPDVELGRSIRQTIEPYRMLIEAEGGTPETAISHLLQTAALFRVGTPAQKQAALMQIAQQYAIPLPQGDVSQQGYADPQGQFRDPRVDDLLQRAQLAEMQAQAERQRQEQAERQRYEGVVQAWENAVDSSGKLLRPYASNVQAEMAAVLPQIMQDTPGLRPEEALQQAYDRAVWAHPEIRPLLLKQQQDEMEAKRRAENQRRVQEAKRAASVNVPRKASVPAASNERRGIDKMGDVITETARELGLLN